MRRAIALVLAILLLPSIPTSSASSNLLEVGVVEDIDGRLVHISFSSENTLLTLNTEGNISSHFWGAGELIYQWSIELNVTANSATPDSTGLLIAVAHSYGVMIINTELVIVSDSYNLSRNINSVVWDNEGNLWFADSSERRSKEYSGQTNDGIGDSTTATGNVTFSHNTAMTAMTIISQERIVTGGRDNLVKVHAQDGSLSNTLSDFNSYPTILKIDSDGDLLVGCANGQLLRYDVNDWSKEEMTISSQESINSITIGENGDLHVGTLNGKLHIVDGITLTETDEYSSPGRVMISFFEDSGELYIVSAFSTSTKFRLFDLDSDGDGVTDINDDFVDDSTQQTDTDGDGYGDNQNGDNPDAFPDDFSQWADSDGDGYGDNPSGNNSDAFINNSYQWSDSDGDGYGDNSFSEGGDRYVDDSSQWVDSDNDGFGDNASGTNGDNCPNVNGFSTQDRRGCKDSDNDGYSDPTENWTTEDGADTMINDNTQWEDFDEDGYGDNLTGRFPDSCPLEAGSSTKAWLPLASTDGNFSLDFQVQDKYGCPDSDGDGFYDQGDDLPDDASSYRDDDGDGVGFGTDYDDSNKLVQTEEQHCTQNVSDVSDSCLGYRDSEYMQYIQEQQENGGIQLSYSAWNITQNAEGDTEGNAAYIESAKEIAPYLGAGFLIVVAVLLLYSGLTKSRRRSALIKTYGEPLGNEAMSAEEEALENRAGLSAMGGVESDKMWEDDIEPMDLSTERVDEMELEEVQPVSNQSLEESKSMEELAGMPVQNEPVAEPVPVMPEEAPPLPKEGLPNGWTMEQWKWYGEEWLAKMGK